MFPNINLGAMLTELGQTFAESGIRIAIALILFLVFNLLFIRPVRWLTRKLVDAIDTDNGSGVVDIPEYAEEAIVRIAVGLARLSAAVIAIRAAGFSTDQALGVGGIVGLAVAFAMKDLLVTIAGGMFALGSKWVATGEYLEAESAKGFIQELGLFKTVLFDPGTGQETLLDNSVFWTDKSIVVSGGNMAHLLHIDCNPDTITPIRTIALEWAGNNPHIDGANWVAAPGSSLTGSGVPMVLSMSVSADASGSLLEKFGKSVGYASDNPLTEKIYAAGHQLSVFDIGGRIETVAVKAGK